MDYNKHYSLLIEKAKSKNRVKSKELYLESHHIVPRCMNGTYDSDNLVNLLPEEHFVAHQLLVKINPKKFGLLTALAKMSGGKRTNNKCYAWIRKRIGRMTSENQKGSGNSQYGKHRIWIHNKQLKQHRKIYKIEEMPAGWEKGIIPFIESRDLDTENKQRLHYISLFKAFEKSPFLSIKSFLKSNNELSHYRDIISCWQNNIIKSSEIIEKSIKSKRDRNKKVFAESIYNNFKNGNYRSLRAFIRSGGYDKSAAYLVRLLKKYIPEYSLIAREGSDLTSEKVRNFEARLYVSS